MEVFKFELGGRELTIEYGKVAKQANAAVMVRYGESVILSTVTASNQPSTLDFFSTNR